MQKLYFVTGNRDKVDEAQKILGLPIEVVDVDINEIQSLDLAKVVKHKAEEAYKKVKKPLFVDDVSFEIKAWNGFPGPFIKFLRIAGNNRHELLLRMLSAEKDRAVRVIAGIGYHDGKKVHIIEGSFVGKIVPRRGDKGWGFDPYVIPHGYTKTLGELDENVKNKISHRARALKKFKELLDRQNK
ncbi:MAG: non-canonical purine NTP pyrophosphatase [Candidatus Levyibacteriota bacterium]